MSSIFDAQLLRAFHTLHKSLVDIALMRVSLEFAGIQVKHSLCTIRETDELLEHVRGEGF